MPHYKPTKNAPQQPEHYALTRWGLEEYYDALVAKKHGVKVA